MCGSRGRLEVLKSEGKDEIFHISFFICHFSLVVAAGDRDHDKSIIVSESRIDDK